MDINKWKSVAIKKEDYLLLKGLCKDKFRAPGAMISKILSDYIDHQARKLRIPNASYRTKPVSYTHLTLPTTPYV